MTQHLPIEKLSWEAARNSVNDIAPELANIIDQISPDTEYPLYRVKYPFGFNLLENGLFHLPDEHGNPVLLSDKRIPESVRADLDYNLGCTPVSLLLEKGLEIYTQFSDHIIPFHVFQPGELLGLSRVLEVTDVCIANNPFNWNISSGVRSCFMGCKISRSNCHNKLKKHFSVSSDVPKALNYHWQVFREIYTGAVHIEQTPEWQSEILLFSRAWFEHRHDPAWQALWLYLYRTERSLTAFWRNHFSWNLTFLKINKYAQLKPAQLDLTKIVKNLLSIATGSMLGFAPAENDQFLPASLLTNVYHDIYELPKYAPLLLQPTYFGMQNHSPVYYSPLHPVYGDFRFCDPTAQMSYINLLDEVYLIAQKHLNTLQSGKLANKSTLLEPLKNEVGLRMFHNTPGGSINILPSEDLPQLDSRFQPTDGKLFPDNSPFLKCCIQVYNKR